MQQRSEHQVGILAGIASYSLWGLFPLYFHSLEPTGPLEVLAHRIVWSFVMMLVVLAVQRNWSWLADLRRDPRRAALIAAAGLLLSVNWLVYVWAVSVDRVIDASLGYFVNPIVTVAMGVFLLKERVRPLQVGALAFGGAAVLILAVAYGQVPWIALTLAFTFAGYGYLKKKVGLETVASLTAETALLFPLAAGGLLWAFLTGRTAIGNHSAFLDVKLLALGAVTAVPLLLFGVATRRIPLVMIGLLQYLTPWGQLLLGWLHYHEPMPPSRLAGFALIWVALALLAFDGVQSVRASRNEATVAPELV
ncbi:MAG: EamA family transporter RarD [Acidimicrobiales bacterium]